MKLRIFMITFSLFISGILYSEDSISSNPGPIINNVVTNDLHWWDKMSRNWCGFSIDLSAAGIFYPSVSYLPVTIKAGYQFLPVLGVFAGGMYNPLYHTAQCCDTSKVSGNMINPLVGGSIYIRYGPADNTDMPAEKNYAPYSFNFGLDLRLPVSANLSLFGEYQFVIADFQRFNLLDKAVVNIGTDVKFGWFGLKLYYEFAFDSTFQTVYQGIGAGIAFWFTENRSLCKEDL